MKPYRLQLLLFALLCFSGFYGNAQSWSWVSHNNFGPRELINVVADQNGYIYASGVDSARSALSKYKPDGTMIWSKDSVGEIVNLSVDAAGNLNLVAGTGQWPFYTFSHIAKLDSAGNQLWAKGIMTPYGPTDLPTAILYAGATDSAGNTYMSGDFQNTSGLTQFDTIALGNLAPHNYYLAKYNSAGKIQWLRFYNDPVYAIACGPQGSYFIECGSYFQKYDSSGTLVWQQNFSGMFSPTIYAAFSNTLKSDGLGNLFVVGDKLAKYNSNNGALAWVKTVAGKDISLTHSGDIIVTGSFNDSLNLGNGVPVLNSGPIYAAQFSGLDGSALWAKQATSSGWWSSGDAIVSLPNGDCVVAGNFKGVSNFDQHTVTGKSFFVAKLSTTLLGRAENKTEAHFQLYPNPATSGVTLSNPDFRNASVEIFNVAGKKVLGNVYSENGSLKVSTESWPAGLYIVKVTAKGKVYNQKLVVSH